MKSMLQCGSAADGRRWLSHLVQPPRRCRRRRMTPIRPIRMIVGFAPGGGTIRPRARLTPKLSERLGQQVIVDNRPGAAGNIATEITTKAPAGRLHDPHGHDRRAFDQSHALRQLPSTAEGSSRR